MLGSRALLSCSAVSNRFQPQPTTQSGLESDERREYQGHGPGNMEGPKLEAGVMAGPYNPKPTELIATVVAKSQKKGK